MGRNDVKVSMVGVGNCASALVQGSAFYRAAGPGLIHFNLGGLRPRDIQFVGAWDVDARKVGGLLREVIVEPPNCTYRAPVTDEDLERQCGQVRVSPAPLLDGLGERLRCHITDVQDTGAGGDDRRQIVSVLRNADVLVNYLPVGSEEASRWWAEAALESGCAFVNAIPVFIANDAAWARRFEDASLPLMGDDIKSQVGATIAHRALVELLASRGVELKRTYQLNAGGNYDFVNLMEPSRLASKRKSKTGAVLDLAPGLDPELDIHISPSAEIPWLGDRKLAFIRLEAEAFLGTPLSIEVRMEVWDSPNSAGCVIDLVRIAKLALERGEGGILRDPCAVYMKAPPTQMNEQAAASRLLEWSKFRQPVAATA